MDNGIPWSIPGGLPAVLSLWAAGLGVPLHHNDPYRPQQNGVVESTQGTSQRWAEPGKCADVQELVRRLEQEDRIQREQYPSIGGLSRRRAYPSLLHSGRGYCLSWERQVWDLGEALRFLGRYRVRRKVSQVGQVKLYDRSVYVGKEYHGWWVYAQMDAATVEWVIRDVAGKELRRCAAKQFTAEAITALNLARP